MFDQVIINREKISQSKSTEWLEPLFNILSENKLRVHLFLSVKIPDQSSAFKHLISFISFKKSHPPSRY